MRFLAWRWRAREMVWWGSRTREEEEILLCVLRLSGKIRIYCHRMSNIKIINLLHTGSEGEKIVGSLEISLILHMRGWQSRTHKIRIKWKERRTIRWDRTWRHWTVQVDLTEIQFGEGVLVTSDRYGVVRAVYYCIVCDQHCQLQIEDGKSYLVITPHVSRFWLTTPPRQTVGQTFWTF